MSRVYLDACSIIYFVEASGAFHDALVAHFTKYEADPGTRFLTSHISRLECRSKPLGDGDNELLARYDGFFKIKQMRLIDITGGVIERATELRARYGLKSIDSIHLASAVSEKADVFITGDVALKRCTEVNVEVVTEDEKQDEGTP